MEDPCRLGRTQSIPPTTGDEVLRPARTRCSTRSTTWSSPPPSRRTSSSLDDARVVRWTGPLFALFSLILLPWTIYLGASLPSRQESPHYDVAWTGFDVILLVGLAATAYFALRRSRYLAISAAATGALLVVDAWFDVMTTPGNQVAQSIVLAAAVELPLAAVCLWLSLHTEHLAERGSRCCWRLGRRDLAAGRDLAGDGDRRP